MFNILKTKEYVTHVHGHMLDVRAHPVRIAVSVPLPQQAEGAPLPRLSQQARRPRAPLGCGCTPSCPDGIATAEICSTHSTPFLVGKRSMQPLSHRRHSDRALPRACVLTLSSNTCTITKQPRRVHSNNNPHIPTKHTLEARKKANSSHMCALSGFCSVLTWVAHH